MSGDPTRIYLCAGGPDVSAFNARIADALAEVPEIEIVRTEDMGPINALAENCRLFVAVLGHCYGAVDPGTGRSQTEIEFDLAEKKGIACLAFTAPGELMVPAYLLVSDTGLEKQTALRRRAGFDRGFNPDATPDDLAHVIVSAVRGWLRDNADGRTSAADAVPIAQQAPSSSPPPKLDFAQRRFPPADFVGRDAERNKLNAWLAQENEPVFIMEGPGGVGKTALVQAWLETDLFIAHGAPSSAVYWSFREPGDSFREMAERVLSNLGFPAEAWATSHDRLENLKIAVRDHGIVLVLDDFGGQLRNDGSSLGARPCRSHEAAAFLRFMMIATPGHRRKAKVLIVSRYRPAELEALPGDTQLSLDGLSGEDAGALCGEKASDAVLAMAKASGNHALVIRLLAGLAAPDPNWIGGLDPTNARQRIIAAAADALDGGARHLLGLVSAFRTPFGAAMAQEVWAGSGNGPGDFQDALTTLERSGILSRDEDGAHFDLHPVLGAYAYGQLDTPAAVHEAFREYYARASGPEDHTIQRLADLRNLVELFHHTVAAGHFDDAYALFSVRLSNWLQYRFGDHETIVTLLESLIPDDGPQCPGLESDAQKGQCLTRLATALRRTGDRQRLTVIEEAITELDTTTGHTWYHSMSLHKLAWSRKSSGDFRLAADNAAESIRLAEESANHHIRAKSLELAADLLICRGRFEAGRAKLVEAAAAWTDMDDRAFQTSLARLREDAAIRCQLALWTGDLEAAERHAEEAFELARTEDDEASLIAAKILSAAANLEAADAGRDRDHNLAEAGGKLRSALADCRRLNLTSLTAKARLSQANYLFLSGQLAEARSQAEDMLFDAERRHLRLYAADMQNLLARIANSGGDHPVAKKHARLAQKQAECDGEGWRYQPAWDLAEKILNGEA